MVLKFDPPKELVEAYLNRPSPGQIASQGINQALQTYAQMKTLQQQEALKKQQTDLLLRKEGREGMEQFYNYGDTTSLPQEIQSQIGQPAQGPATEAGVSPQVPPLIDRFNEFLKQNPSGLKGSERKTNTALQQSEIDKNNAMADMYGKKLPPGSPKPQLRQNAFSGEWEWHQPPGMSTPTAGGQPASPIATPAHGPGTFRDVSKAAGSFAEDKTLIDGVISEINRVKVLNKNSRGGVTGSLLQKGQSALNIGTDSPEFRSTADVINTLKGAVSRVLKSTFGGQLSDAERDYLDQVYGASEKMSPAERDIAMTNIETMLRNKSETSGAKYSALSGNAQLGAGQPSAVGLDPARKSRLEELRAKRDAGTLR